MRRALCFAVVGSVGAVAGAVAGAGCDAELTFAEGRELEPCVGNYPTACGSQARCVLDEEHYLAGEFPGSRRFIVRTEGEALLDVQFLLVDRRNPGSDFRLVVHEPVCGERYLYDAAGQDLFRLIGADGVLLIPMKVLLAGDHLVELISDAYCGYYLKVNAE
ncbi:MAG: hypothetical protein V2A73_18850 [Pseudomonadota bacterium]